MFVYPQIVRCKVIYLAFILLPFNVALGQVKDSTVAANANVSLKINVLSLVTTKSLNVAVELPLGKHDKARTIHLPVSYNPFTLSDNRRYKHISFQPELRFWSGEACQNFFIGAHATYANYNIGGINLPFNISPALKEKRYEGYLLGAGASAGYVFKLDTHFRIETVLGIGYLYMDQAVYNCESCGTKIKDEKRHYTGPTKASVSMAYIF